MEATLPSYIWDRETVRKVSNLIVSRNYYVSDELILDLKHEGSLGLIEAQEKRVVLIDLQNQIRVYGVEAHPDDIDLTAQQWNTDLHRTIVKITGRWKPHTHDVMLYGGPQDGGIWVVRDAPYEPLIMERPTVRLANWLPHFDAPPLEAAVEKTFWKFSGWHEQRRCWIYTQDGK